MAFEVHIHNFGGVPSGASTGSYEAVELRDGGKRCGGKGVREAVLSTAAGDGAVFCALP